MASEDAKFRTLERNIESLIAQVNDLSVRIDKLNARTLTLVRGLRRDRSKKSKPESERGKVDAGIITE